MKVEIFADDRLIAEALHVFEGDSILFTAPSSVTDGPRALMVEEHLARLQRQEELLKLARLRESGLRELVRQMSQAGSLEEVAGLAWRAGELNEECW